MICLCKDLIELITLNPFLQFQNLTFFWKWTKYDRIWYCYLWNLKCSHIKSPEHIILKSYWRQVFNNNNRDTIICRNATYLMRSDLKNSRNLNSLSHIHWAKGNCIIWKQYAAFLIWFIYLRNITVWKVDSLQNIAQYLYSITSLRL